MTCAPLLKETNHHRPGSPGRPRDPYANPLYAALAGHPPVYIQVGGDEVLLDDSRRLAERARKAGVDVRLDIFPGLQHTFHFSGGRAPEADDAIRRLAEWVRPKLGLPDAAPAAGVRNPRFDHFREVKQSPRSRDATCS